MAKSHYLPYGYCIRNGAIAIDTEQAEWVRRIYEWYLENQSMQNIANHLQAAGISYGKDCCWNKNVIHRILKNTAYCGERGYSPIIQTAQFQKVQALCKQKSPIYTEELKCIRNDIICANCSNKLEWQADRRQWRCRYCTTTTIKIEPDILLQSIAAAIRRLQESQDQLETPLPPTNALSLDALKQQAEIDTLLTSERFDIAELIEKILTCANTQYNYCSVGNADPMTLRIKKILADKPLCNTFDPELYRSIVDKVILHRTTSVQLKLVNGMII